MKYQVFFYHCHLYARKQTILPLPHICKKIMHLYVVLRFSIKGYNFSTNDMKMSNPLMIFILDHEEVWITIGTSNPDPITNFLCHQQLKSKENLKWCKTLPSFTLLTNSIIPNAMKSFVKGIINLMVSPLTS